MEVQGFKNFRIRQTKFKLHFDKVLRQEVFNCSKSSLEMFHKFFLSKHV